MESKRTEKSREHGRRPPRYWARHQSLGQDPSLRQRVLATWFDTASALRGARQERGRTKGNLLGKDAR